MVLMQSMNTSDTMDCACNRTATSNTNPAQMFDSDAVKFCFTFGDYPLTQNDTSNLTFEVFPSLQLMPYVLTSTFDQYSQTNSRFFTLRLWFQRIPNQNSLTITQTLFEHDGVVQVYITNSGFIGVKAAGGISNTMTQRAIPYNQWIYVEAYVNTLQYGLTVFAHDGTLLCTNFNGYWPFHNKILAPKFNIWIAQDFSGLIYAVRYSTETSTPSSPPNQPQSISLAQTTQSNILVQFSFVAQQRYQVFGFQNLAVKVQNNLPLPTQYITGTLNQDYLSTVWHEPNSTFKQGYITQTSTFDGITCQGSASQSFQVSSSIHYAEITMSQSSLDSITVEFWFKPTQRNMSVQQLLVISQANGQPIFSITKVQSNLFCFPQQLSNDTGSKLQYTNFDDSLFVWHHISCSFSKSLKQIKGLLFRGSQQFQYFYVLQGSALSLVPYYLTLGNSHAQNQSYSGLFIKEVRVWSILLDSQVISDNRMKIQQSKSLIAYLKLQSSFQLESQSLQSPKLVGQWSKTPDQPFLCPLFTYSNNSVCFRDQYSSLRVLILRTYQGDYQLVPLLQQQNGIQKLDVRSVEWSYIPQNSSAVSSNFNSVQQSIASQSTNPNITLLATQVKQTDIYLLQLRFKGAPFMFDLTTSITVVVDQCTGILDQNTQLTWVVQDLNYQQNQLDIVQHFETVQCPQSISGYSLDLVQAQIVNYPQIPISIQANSITIRAVNQNALPLNEYFYVTVTATWRSTNLTDVTLRLVYQMRFVSKIVLNVVALPLAVPRLQSLVINITSTSIINIQPAQISGVTYSLSWICPTQLQAYCAGTNSILTIPYSAFLSANLQFWTKYPITAVATPNFIQGDETISSSATVNALWVNIAPGDGVIYGSNLIDSGVDNVYSVDFNEIIENSVAINWKITPQAGNSLQRLNQRQCNLQAGMLQPNTSYVLQALLVFIAPTNQVISTASFNIQTLPQPTPGSFKIVPNQGVALVTKFMIVASNFTSNSTLQFQLFIQPFNASIRVLTEPMSQQKIKNLTLMLPATESIILRVFFNQTTSSISLAYPVNVVFSQSSLIVMQQYPVAYLAVLSIENVQNFTLQQQVAQAAMQNINNTFNSTRVRLEILDRITTIHQIYDRSLGTQIQSYFTTMTNSYNLAASSSMLRDQEQLMLLLNIQSNLLKGCEWLENSRQFTSWDTDKDIQFVTGSIRDFLVRFETAYAFEMAESDVFNATFAGFSIYMRKYSSMQNNVTDVQDTTDIGNHLAYKFPMSQACQSSVRQTLTVIMFSANPFLSWHPLNQTVVSNTTLYTSYRDVYGYGLPAQCLQPTITSVFYYQFTPYFVQSVTTCGIFTTQNSSFQNSSCQTTFNKSNNHFTCFCSFQGQSIWTTVLEDYFVRPLPLPPSFLTFKDWPTFVAFAYTCCFTLIGLMFTYTKDLSDFKHLRDIHFKSDSELMRQRNLPLDLISLAQKRQVAMMPFSDKFTTFRLWVLLATHTHPLLQLSYSLDPQLSKLNKFTIFATRLWISMLASFLMLGQSGSKLTPVSVALLAVSVVTVVLMLSALPNSFYSRLKHKYRLRVSPNVQQQSDHKRVKFVDEVVYECDTNLPIRLLFILNSLPLLNPDNLESVRFASGRAADLCDKLTDLKQEHFEGGEDESEYESYYATSSMQDSHSQVSLGQVEFQETKGEDIIDTERSKKQIREVEVKLEQRQSGTKQTVAPSVEPSIESTTELQSPKAIAENLSPLKQKDSIASVTSFNSDVYQNERKEFYESDYNLETSFWLYGICLGVILLFLAPSIYMFVAYKIYAQEGNYLWVIVFFAGQVISLVVVNPLTCLLIARHIVRVRKQGSKAELLLLCEWLRESLIIYEDYQFTVQFQESRVN